MPITIPRLIVVACLLAGPGHGESKGGVAPVNPAATAATDASLRELLGHMVRSQLESCPGVEVHKRGAGFIAGRFGGPTVVVATSGECLIVNDGRHPPKAFLFTHWSTQDPGSREPIAVLDRKVAVGGATCPTDFMTPALMREVEPAVGHLCREAFVPMRENVPLADFFFPILSPLGTVRLSADPGVLLFERGGRTFELKGKLTCQSPSHIIEAPMLGLSELRSLVLDGDITLRDPAAGAIIGRWSETVVSVLGLGCDSAFQIKANQKTMAEARTRFEERVFVATERVLDETRRGAPSPGPPGGATPSRGQKDTARAPLPPPATTMTNTAPSSGQLSLVAELLPLLAGVGTVHGDVDQEGREVMVIRQGARTLRIEGSIACQEIEGDHRVGEQPMKAYHVVADLSVHEPDGRAVLGRWHETSKMIIGRSCSAAYAMKGNATKVSAFRELLRGRIMEAVER